MRGLQTLSSGENSAVDTESEDMAEGGLAWADRSEREVDVLLKDMFSYLDNESTLGCREEERFEPKLSVLPLFSIFSRFKCLDNSRYGARACDGSRYTLPLFQLPAEIAGTHLLRASWVGCLRSRGATTPLSSDSTNTAALHRSQVFRTTRVRTALKKDGSWIQKSKEENEEQDEAGMEHTVKTKPAPIGMELKPQEEPLVETKPGKAAQLEDAGVKSTKQPAETRPPEDVFKAEPVVVVEPLPDTRDVIQATPEEEASVREHKEPDPDLVAESESKSPTECAPEAATEEGCEKCPPEQNTEETVEAVAEAVVESSPDMSDVIQTTPKKEAFLQNKNEPNPELVVESESKPPTTECAPEAATEEGCEKCPPEQNTEETVEAVAEAVVESSPDMNDVIQTTPKKEAFLQNKNEPNPELVVESESKPPTTECAPEAAPEGHCEKCPPEQNTEETAEAVVQSSPEIPAVNNATPSDKAALHGTVEPVYDASSKSPPQPAVETEVKCVEPKAEIKAPAEARAEEAVECQVQPVNDTVFEKSTEPAPENSSAGMTESSNEDVREPAPEADELCDRAIELTDALDVEPPKTEAPEPVKDPKQSHPEEPKVNQANNTNNDGKPICSFCDQVIDGNTKISLSEPLVTCHADCLKCGACAKVLGDLLTPMFLHDQVCSMLNKKKTGIAVKANTASQMKAKMYVTMINCGENKCST
ncbi:hypothetical protein INR49_015621 [Caranx melampygus]|nr:hypothetical protein INR49_015621 [Caranx melampygus]